MPHIQKDSCCTNDYSFFKAVFYSLTKQDVEVISSN